MGLDFCAVDYGVDGVIDDKVVRSLDLEGTG